MGLKPSQLCSMITHVQGNTDTGPDDVMLCAKPKLYVTVMRNQARICHWSAARPDQTG